MKPTDPALTRVLLVDDSAVALAMLRRMLSGVPGIEVVATASNGREALEAVKEHDPAVVVTDLYMPVMDGLELTRRIMQTCPRPVLAVSVAVREKDSPQAFSLLEAGALDLLPKPSVGNAAEWEECRQDLIRKIRILSGVRVFRRKESTAAPAGVPAAVGPARLVVMGASTGGPQALLTILSQLPADHPVPLACVQHISHGFLEGMVEWLQGHCSLTLEVLGGEIRPRPGRLYFPPEDRHLKVVRGGMLSVSAEDPVRGHRPSINLAMSSAAAVLGREAVGVLLSGMGEDGVEGMERLHAAGAFTIAQDAESCVVYGMPARAVERGAVRRQMTPAEIGRWLGRLEGP